MLERQNENSVQLEDGTHYITITQSEHMTQHTLYEEANENVYSSQLVISNVKPVDSGVYLCFGVNQNGYSYRKAHLNIQYTRFEQFKNEFKLTLVILIPTLLFAVILLFLVVYLRKHRKQIGFIKKSICKIKNILRPRALNEAATLRSQDSDAKTTSTYCYNENLETKGSLIYYKIIDPTHDECLSVVSSSSSPSRFYYQLNNTQSDSSVAHAVTPHIHS